MSELGSLSPDELNELVGAFFDGEVKDVVVPDPSLLSEIEADIALLRQIDVRAQDRQCELDGPLGTGAMVIRGVFDVFDRAADVLYAQKERAEELGE